MLYLDQNHLEPLIISNFDEEFVVTHMGGILDDIMYVWEALDS